MSGTSNENDAPSGGGGGDDANVKIVPSKQQQRFAVATAAMTLVSMVLTAAITLKTNTIDAALTHDLKTRQDDRDDVESRHKQVIEKLDSDIRRQHMDLQILQSRNDMAMKVYGEVKAALAAQENEAGIRQQKATSALVLAMLSDQRDLQIALQTVLSENSILGAQSTLAENRYVAEQAATDQRIEQRVRQVVKAESSAEFGSYDFDVFWCEASKSSAERAAESISTVLRGATTGRVRTRLLPIARNNDPGYRNEGFIIRYNANESDILKRLAALAGPAASAVLGGNPGFEPKLSLQQTSWYVSIFVCPGALGGP